MYKNKTISVVIPAYNEEKLIGRVIETMPDFVDKIIVVDDCSQDQTVQMVKCYQTDLLKRSVTGFIFGVGTICFAYPQLEQRFDEIGQKINLKLVKANAPGQPGASRILG